MSKIIKEKLDLIPLYHKLGEAENDDFKLIILANTFLELLINILIQEKVKNKNKVVEGNEYTYSIKLLILNEKNLIDDILFKYIDTLRKIRNKVAHEPVFNLHIEDLKDLPIRKNEKLYNGCITIIGSLWNRHKDLFIKYFNL
jgi:hypothetical protein